MQGYFFSFVLFIMIGPWLYLVYNGFFRKNSRDYLDESFIHFQYWWKLSSKGIYAKNNIRIVPIENVYSTGIIGYKIDYNLGEKKRFSGKKQILILENIPFLIKLFSNFARIFLFLGNLFILLIQIFLWTDNLDIIGIPEKGLEGPILMITLTIIIFLSFILSRVGILFHKLGQQSMESLGFEKSFDAFSKDPIEARIIITPAFMDRLEQFSNKWNLGGKIRIIWEKDTFTLLLKGNIETYGKETDGSYTLIKSMEEILNLGYYSLNTNNQYQYV